MKYKNIKHVMIHGCKPGEIIESEVPLIGGSFELIEKKKRKKEDNISSEMI